MSLSLALGPSVAGTFYPDDPVELRAAVRGYVAAASSLGRAEGPPPHAVIAPHAGYMYSGPIAGIAFAALAPLRGVITRVVILGPAHRFAFEGLALPEADEVATPLGVLPVDREARTALLGMPDVIASDRAHLDEHSIEVELPFVQEVLGDVSVVPIAVGEVSDVSAASVLDAAWSGPETCVVVSSDLSHYYAYDTAQRLDRATARAIEQLSPEQIIEAQACGRIGIRALLRVARARGLHPTTLDIRTSGDTAGARDRVVGYGAFAFA
jgi:AmmeMemoRadiSam system protein B